MDLLDYVNNISGVKPDKYDLGYINEFYNDLFSPKRLTCKKILEIGIEYGLSLLFWKDFFINADIYGIDINYCETVVDCNRIYPYFLDAYKTSTLDLFESESFDIVIDDGPHTLESLIFFCKKYINLVKPGGILVVEDIIDTNWTPILLECIDKKFEAKVFSMAGKCLNNELNNRWNDGLDIIVIKK